MTPQTEHVVYALFVIARLVRAIQGRLPAVLHSPFCITRMRSLSGCLPGNDDKILGGSLLNDRSNSQIPDLLSNTSYCIASGMTVEDGPLKNRTSPTPEANTNCRPARDAGPIPPTAVVPHGDSRTEDQGNPDTQGCGIWFPSSRPPSATGAAPWDDALLVGLASSLPKTRQGNASGWLGGGVGGRAPFHKSGMNPMRPDIFSGREGQIHFLSSPDAPSARRRRSGDPGGADFWIAGSARGRSPRSPGNDEKRLGSLFSEHRRPFVCGAACPLPLPLLIGTGAWDGRILRTKP